MITKKDSYLAYMKGWYHGAGCQPLSPDYSPESLKREDKMPLRIHYESGYKEGVKDRKAEGLRSASYYEVEELEIKESVREEQLEKI